MKIAFIAGCLEPGHDGVGDYTRTLAAECARRGHAVALVSLAEREKIGDAAPGEMPLLRLTTAEWRADGGRAVRRWLEAFAPDWASLQFVPYSFDPRGFFGASIAPLAHLLGGARWRHVFFHEVWIGSQAGAPLKARMFGAWQRRAVAALLRKLAPSCVHTSTAYYRAALVTLRQPASLLRMFGSVPRTADALSPRNRADVADAALVCGHFGTLHPGWNVDAFLADFATLAAEQRRPAALVAAGSLGYGEARFAQIAAAWKDRVTLVALGRLPAEELARVFARFDFAVTSVPWNILGKSSSAAALREHGLRVVVTEAGAPPRFTTRPIDDAGGDDGFVPYFRERTRLSAALAKTVPRPGAAATAERFLADLHASR
jgi:glycosyltransferase involved in cell wall biosynthesis